MCQTLHRKVSGNKQPKFVLWQFTLIEMLVVITIIAILAAILMPSLRSAIESAYAAACRNNLQQTNVAGNMYANDHDGFMLGYNQQETYFLSRQSAPKRRHLGTIIDSGVLAEEGGPEIFYCPGSEFAPSWTQRQPNFSSETSTPKHLYQIGHDARCSYLINPLLCNIYWTKRNSTFDFYTGFRIQRVPSDFGLAADLSLTNDTYAQNHETFFNFTNVDGSTKSFPDPVRLLRFRSATYQNQPSRIDIGTSMRVDEALLECMNGVIDPP